MSRILTSQGPRLKVKVIQSNGVESFEYRRYETTNRGRGQEDVPETLEHEELIQVEQGFIIKVNR